MLYRLVAAILVLSMPASALAQRGQATALVEDVKGAPSAGVDFMDFVYPGQAVALGAKGEIVLSYFANCRVETIQGGNVTVGADQSAVSGGRVSVKTRPCDAKKFQANFQTAEAGASVKRFDGPFDPKVWRETAIRSARPIFRFPAGTTAVKVYDLDGRAPQLLWESPATKAFLEYPARAPALQPGVSYGVEAVGPAGKQQARFSIDPELDLPDSPLNRTVPLGPR